MSQQQLQQQPVSSLENTLKAFMMKTESYMAENNNFIKRTDAFMNRTEMRLQNQETAIKTLETQVGQFAQNINTRPQGLPSNTEVAKVIGHEQCKAITTRSVYSWRKRSQRAKFNQQIQQKKRPSKLILKTLPRQRAQQLLNSLPRQRQPSRARY